MSQKINLSARALHWVFRVADREASMQFFLDILGMKVLRHEEFEEGCQAACNGPFDGKWSKTMVGYGPEDTHFVVEITYNYGIKQYEFGNDFQYIEIHSSEAAERAAKAGFSSDGEGVVLASSPDGYPFRIVPKAAVGNDPVMAVCIQAVDMEKSVEYWNGALGLQVAGDSNLSNGDRLVQLSLGDHPWRLRLLQLAANEGKPLQRGTAFGRIAFACPADQLPGIQSAITEQSYTVLTPLVSLDTPGKATVQVVILADPDGQEICFVGDEAFVELSQVDPNGDKLLKDAMAADNSKAWFEKKAKRAKELEAKLAAQQQ